MQRLYAIIVALKTRNKSTIENIEKDRKNESNYGKSGKNSE
jgi:hypothetical protein